MTDKSSNTRVFADGDPVHFFDLRRRFHGDRLKTGGQTDVRGEIILHDDVIGQPNGTRLKSKRQRPFWAYFPTMPEFALSMARGATIIYPKDAAYLVMHADIGPGMRIVEGGAGSGALSMALLRALGPTGHLTTYDIRQDALNRARKNVTCFLGVQDQHDLLLRDIYNGIKQSPVDRIVLDVPEPWRVLDTAADVLIDGGIMAAYLPTVLQVHQHVTAARAHQEFFTTETIEVLERKWHVADNSARPMHQMVGHTGFICLSRRVGRPQNPEAEIAQ